MFSFLNDATTSMFLVLGSCRFLVCSLFCVQSVVVSSVCPVFCVGLCFVSVAVCVHCLVQMICLQSWSWCFFPFLFQCTSLYVLSFYFPVPLSSSYAYSVCQCVLLPVLFLTRPHLICIMFSIASPVLSESPTDLCHIVVIYLPHALCSVSPSSQIQPCLLFCLSSSAIKLLLSLCQSLEFCTWFLTHTTQPAHDLV